MIQLQLEKDMDLVEKFIDLKNQNNSLIYEINLIKQLLLKESKLDFKKYHFCPICGELSIFNSVKFGKTPRYYAQCPNCGSLERHRLVFFLFLNKYWDLLTNKNIKLLHFAPEDMFYDFFKKHSNIDYFPVDINPVKYDAKNILLRDLVNMEDIPYDDDEFDVIYNCHVLEHVPDDIKAMGELYRVLKPDGVCIIMIPQFPYLEETLEKEEYNTPELRLKHYGQRDHLRKYGLDFKDRLESVGFNVQEVKTDDLVHFKVDINLLRLTTDTIFICTK